MQRKIISGLTLVLLCSCNPTQKIGQGGAMSGESFTMGSDAPAPMESQAVVTAESQDQVAGEQPQSLPQTSSAEPDAEDGDTTKTALEPVPIGGAFLTCRYQNGQIQGNESYRMDCEVAPIVEVKAAIVSAAFYKVDAQGNRSALTILSQNLVALKWTVQENMATMSQTQVQVALSVPGLLSVALKTTVSPMFSLVQNPNYWLGGEPNNLADDDDCTEFVPASGKVAHQNFSGIVSGPLGRMNDIVCTASYNFLCRNVRAGATAAKWMVSASPGPFADGNLACNQGYAFGFPLNATEVREVITLVDRLDLKVWANMSDRVTEGLFSIKFR